MNVLAFGLSPNCLYVLTRLHELRRRGRVRFLNLHVLGLEGNFANRATRNHE